MAAPILETDEQRQAAALIGERVGQGGMGVVFEAIHESLGLRAAIKVLHHHAPLPK